MRCDAVRTHAEQNWLIHWCILRLMWLVRGYIGVWNNKQHTVHTHIYHAPALHLLLENIYDLHNLPQHWQDGTACFAASHSMRLLENKLSKEVLRTEVSQFQEPQMTRAVFCMRDERYVKYHWRETCDLANITLFTSFASRLSHSSLVRQCNIAITQKCRT